MNFYYFLTSFYPSLFFFILMQSLINFRMANLWVTQNICSAKRDEPDLLVTLPIELSLRNLYDP